MEKKPQITAIIPTLNEEGNIKGAIESVRFADEIIVIDSFSTDGTVALVNEAKVKLIQRKFDDFSSQKNYALALATHNWIYVLDADERVGQDLKNEILEAVQKPGESVGFYVFRTFYFNGRKLKFSGTQNDKVIRLFRKDRCKYDGRLVHERIETTGQLAYLKHKLDHYSYHGYDHYISKLNHYATLKAITRYEKGKKVNPFHLIIKPPVRFFIHYFIRLGILDGFPGFIISTLHSYGVLTRYIKLWLMNHKLK